MVYNKLLNFTGVTDGYGELGVNSAAIGPFARNFRATFTEEKATCIMSVAHNLCDYVQEVAIWLR